MTRYYIYKRNYDVEVASPGQYVDPTYIFTASANPNSASYDDVTTNTNWHNYGVRHFDYLFAREQIRLESHDWTKYENFTKVPTVDQKVACQYFVVPAASRSLYYTAEEQRTHWNILARKAIECREERWEDGRQYASFTLGLTDSTQMGIDTDDIANEWVKYSTNKLFEWFEGTGSFSGSGFPATDYYDATVKTNLLDILQNGIRH